MASVKNVCDLGLGYDSEPNSVVCGSTKNPQER